MSVPIRLPSLVRLRVWGARIKGVGRRSHGKKIRFRLFFRRQKPFERLQVGREERRKLVVM